MMIKKSLEQWEYEFDKLKEELEIFRDNFKRKKSCKCSIENCKHFKIARHKIFGERIDYLYNLRMQLGYQTYNEIIKPIIRN